MVQVKVVLTAKFSCVTRGLKRAYFCILQVESKLFSYPGFS